MASALGDSVVMLVLAMSGAAISAHRLNSVRYSSGLLPSLPTWSRSGSFHAPGRASAECWTVRLKAAQHRSEVVLDVGRGPPQVGDRTRPRPWIVPGVGVGHREDDWAPGRTECVAHPRVQRLLDLLLRLAREVAVGDAAAVVLEVVDAPGRERGRVLGLVAVAPGPVGARGGAGVFVEAEPEAQAVHVVGHRLDPAREAGGVRNQVAGAVPVRGHPAVVDIHVVVAGRLHAVADHRLSGLLHQAGVDPAERRVPVVPAHRRGRGEAVALGSRWRGEAERGKASRREAGREQPYAAASHAQPRLARESIAWAAEQARAQGASILIGAVNSYESGPYRLDTTAKT